MREERGRLTDLTLAMADYEAGCPQRLQHLLKVWGFARNIGIAEGLDEKTQEILEAAAIVHDIGILPSLEKYGSAAGEHQEKEGPPVARELLAKYGYAEDITGRVAYLVGHHHTYKDIDGADYQILVEADFLVNMFEGGMEYAAREAVYRNIFRTEAGKRLFRAQFPLE